MRFSGFDWDEGNTDKCKKHGVKIEEIEAVFENEALVYINEQHASDEERYSAVDIKREGRGIFVVFTRREKEGEDLIRPISARYMRKKEKKYYERQKET